MYYDRQGRLMNMTTWVATHSDPDYRIVAQHYVRGWMISTIWLGVDHRFIMSGAPVIFETMIFPPGDEAGGRGAMSEDYMERYSTEDAAQAGHDRALSWVREKLGDESTADIMSAAQFGDPWTVPDDASDLE